MLLGVDGVCIIAHGSSSERAIVNGINVAREMVEGDVVGEISRAIRPPAAEGRRRRCPTAKTPTPADPPTPHDKFRAGAPATPPVAPGTFPDLHA